LIHDACKSNDKSLHTQQGPGKVTAADPVQRQRPADADGGIIVSQPRLVTLQIRSIHEVKKVSLISESLMPVGNSIDRKSVV
jgi:hypothetical protein